MLERPPPSTITSGSGEKVSFPVAWHSAVLGLGRPLADGDGIDDLPQSALRGAALGLALVERHTKFSS
jgi:hypothetical protein